MSLKIELENVPYRRSFRIGLGMVLKQPWAQVEPEFREAIDDSDLELKRAVRTLQGAYRQAKVRADAGSLLEPLNELLQLMSRAAVLEKKVEKFDRPQGSGKAVTKAWQQHNENLQMLGGLLDQCHEAMFEVVPDPTEEQYRTFQKAIVEKMPAYEWVYTDEELVLSAEAAFGGVRYIVNYHLMSDAWLFNIFDGDREMLWDGGSIDEMLENTTRSISGYARAVGLQL